MFKTLTSFFRFYYYTIRRSPKKYDIAMHPIESTIAGCTPLFGFLGFVLISIIFFNPSIALVFPLFIPIILVNMFIVHKTSDEGFRIRREEDRKRENFRRMEREYEAEERMERARVEYERILRERLRQLREEQRRNQERQYQQKYEYQHRQQKQEQKQQPSKSNNTSNAMKLLGLSDGYTAKDVKSAYRRLAKIHHPDLGGLQANFIKLTKAYDYLMDRIEEW